MNVFNINLIAARRRQKQHAIALLRLAIYSLIGLAVMIGLVYGKMTVQISQVEGDIAKVTGELTSPGLAANVSRIQYLEQQTKDLAPRVQLLEKVHSSESEWIRILQDVSSCIPPNVWIGQLSSQRNEKDQVISLRGKAFSQRDVGAFMLDLDKPAWSALPALSYSQVQSDKNVGSVVEFEISVPLQYVIGSDLK